MMRSRVHRVRARRAAILVVAMVVLLVLTLLGGELVRTLLLAHRGTMQRDRELQCLWLAEAGVARGLAQWKADAEYKGEVWKPVLSPPNGSAPSEPTHAARIVIQIESADGKRQLRVEAIYPDHPTDRIAIERVHPLPSGEEASP